MSSSPASEIITGAPVALGGPRGLAVTRTLPSRTRRMVGAWCFLDAYGPVTLDASPPSSPLSPSVSSSQGMRVAPHPHTGLQTVSWLVSGEVLHRDSRGSVQLIEPGALNLMTAGRGIAHSEQTPALHSPVLHGVQLWVALPEGARHMAPSFAHHGDLPLLSDAGVDVTVIMGELGGATSPASVHTPISAAQIALEPGSATALPLKPAFEYACLVLSGHACVDGIELSAGPLLYVGSGLRGLTIRTARPAAPGSRVVVLLIGGEPFEEELVMWWNFVGRSHEEIVQARQEWQDGADRFGVVHGYDGDRLPAPTMPTSMLKPRGRLR